MEVHVMSKLSDHAKRLRKTIRDGMQDVQDKFETLSTDLDDRAKRQGYASGQVRITSTPVRRLAKRIVDADEKERLEHYDGDDHNDFFFYGPATVVRLPKENKEQDFQIRIQRDAPDSAEVERGGPEIEVEDNFYGGFYLMKDGSIVIQMPEEGFGIDLVIQADPKNEQLVQGGGKNAPAIADDGLNVKC
jgi:hypothetical protein